MENIKTLSQMHPGETGVIVEVQGGRGFIKRLEDLGLRKGKKITKLSSQILRGPQVVKIDNIQIALGKGVSSKILVKLEER